VGLGRKFIAVNHMEGHLLSPFFGRDMVAPAVGLVVSGGHTLLVDLQGLGRYRILGSTQDDAAGEAFDKVGKLLGLPYPGGPHLNEAAKSGDPTKFDFPRSMLHSGDFSFSFSGLKTSVRYLLPKLDPVPLADVCASFQEAVVDVLVAKTLAAARSTGHSRVAVSGGVSCNSRLREKLELECSRNGLELLLAQPQWCTDNAAMIAYVAWLRLREGQCSPLDEEIDPNLRLGGQ
jgi:N6-L-threonylcarbamoyladenine synthase